MRRVGDRIDDWWFNDPSNLINSLHQIQQTIHCSPMRLFQCRCDGYGSVVGFLIVIQRASTQHLTSNDIVCSSSDDQRESFVVGDSCIIAFDNGSRTIHPQFDGGIPEFIHDLVSPRRNVNHRDHNRVSFGIVNPSNVGQTSYDHLKRFAARILCRGW